MKKDLRLAVAMFVLASLVLGLGWINKHVTDHRMPESLCAEAKAAVASGQFEKAEENYREALRMDPRCARAYLGLYSLVDSTGRISQNINDEMRRYKEQFPGDEQITIMRAKALLMEGAITDAMREVESLSSPSSSIDVNSFRASLCLIMGDVDGAKTCYKEILLSYPHNAEANMMLAILAKQSENP